MLQRLKALLTEPDAAAGQGHSFEDKQVAAAALLVEAASLDGSFGGEERTIIMRLLRERFDLSEAERDALLEEAEVRTEQSQVHRFTRAVVDHFTHDERVELVEMLWEVAYADGVLHDYEANLLRRIGGLIYVSERERGDARKRVMARMGARA